MTFSTKLCLGALGVPKARDVQRALHPLMIWGGPGPGVARPQASEKRGKRKKKKKRGKREREKNEIIKTKWDIEKIHPNEMIEIYNNRRVSD